MPRLSKLTLFLSALFCLALLHFLSLALNTPVDFSNDEDDNWSERLGLDHYADWEAGVTDAVGDGLGKVREGLGVIKGGLGWGARRAKLGSLYELIVTSNPSPRPAYYDRRTSIARLRLTSTRVLGHGVLDSSSAEADDHEQAFPGRTRRHILVTGGFGSLGKHVIRDMLLGTRTGSNDEESGEDGTNDEEVLITLLDIVDRTPELNYLLQSTPGPKLPTKIKGTDPRTQSFTSSERSVESFKRSGQLRIIIGDIRDSQLVATLLKAGSAAASNTGISLAQQAAILQASGGKTRKTKVKGWTTAGGVVLPPVSGVVHLAAYSPSACRLNLKDCESVETEGMKAILEALSGVEAVEKAQARVNMPWLVVPRRGDGWREFEGAHAWNASRLSTPASHGLLKTFSISHPLHSLLLQLPSSHSIIGDPYSPRFDPVPHIVHSALGHLPIQVYTDPAITEAFLAIGDASRAIIQGARMLELASRKEYVRQMAFVAELRVGGPPAIGGTAALAKTAISLARSQSPFAQILEDELEGEVSAKELVAQRIAARKTAAKVLGFSPSQSVRTALKTYMASLLRLQALHLSAKISVTCSSPPSVPVLEEGLLALSSCNVQFLTLIDGAYFTLACSAGLEGASDKPLALVGAIPFKEGVQSVEVLVERGLEGKVDVQLRCPASSVAGKAAGKSEVIIWIETEEGGQFVEQSTPGARAIAEWFSVDFVRRDSRAFTLTLPPTEGVDERDQPKYRLTRADPYGNDKKLVFQTPGNDARPLLWRVNPICCPEGRRRKDVWDYFKDDPVITSQVTYPSEDGRTSLVDSTLSVQRCRDYRQEHDALVALQISLESPNSGALCDPPRGEAADWAPKDLPVCSIDCSAPLVCLASNACKCTRDRCGDARSEGPFHFLAYSDRLSHDTKSAQIVPRVSLVDRVAAIPWDAVILPGARRAFASSLDELPRAHVVDLPDTIDNHLKSEACWNLDKSPLPFMGDHFLIEALRNRTVAIEEADFVVVPYYQGCYYNYLQENTFKKLADTIGFIEPKLAPAQITASRIAIPFTHDFGSCTGWWPRLEDVLGRSPPSPMGQAVAWQVNGDYNTHCVKPDRDVVIPAVTKHTKALAETYASISSIAPISSRRHLGFFAGGVRGFGAVARTRIGCGRTNATTTKSKILYQRFSPGLRYVGTLNTAKFCLLPRGIPSWTTRTYEAIYAGCIPAFIVDRNSLPFQDILDYSLFSVTIPENEADRVEEILESYDDVRLAEMQAYLVKVREAFLFKEGEEWGRKGPLFFALVSMAMRLPLGYPATSSCLAA